MVGYLITYTRITVLDISRRVTWRWYVCWN